MDYHVAVTGASSGIGEAIARQFGKRGARLTLVARRMDPLERLASEFPGKAQAVAKDLVDSPNACTWLAPAQETFGPIDVLVNNAGMENTGPTALSSIDQGVQLLHLNLHTPLLLTRTMCCSLCQKKA
jgi:NADP-dependent 3-hydroxy acid dehydrogenase YdfG